MTRPADVVSSASRSKFGGQDADGTYSAVGDMQGVVRISKEEFDAIKKLFGEAGKDASVDALRRARFTVLADALAEGADYPTYFTRVRNAPENSRTCP